MSVISFDESKSLFRIGRFKFSKSYNLLLENEYNNQQIRSMEPKLTLSPFGATLSSSTVQARLLPSSESQMLPFKRKSIDTRRRLIINTHLYVLPSSDPAAGRKIHSRERPKPSCKIATILPESLPSTRPAAAPPFLRK